MSEINLPPETTLEPNPRAIVVGASSGIGAAVSRRLAQEGYLVAALARREDLLAELCSDINSSAGQERAYPFAHDVTKYDEVPELFQRLLRDLRRVDLVVYSAGVLQPVGISEYPFEKDRLGIEVNLLGAMAWLGQAAALFEKMQSGSIVGVSSVAGDRGRVRNPGYNAAKAGLDAYLEGLRNRLTRHGVHVLTFKPGFVQTKMLEGADRTFWVISPEQAADALVMGVKRRKQQMYVPGRWRLMMFAIRNTPSFVFRRLSF
ncbi:MAG: SDR family NAD(P)-dependent oxidoreductase [Anaerolineales bacterium]|nr:SDR family NAD(P)-dependent oxidoreductase [Anaerolineales bacterium]